MGTPVILYSRQHWSPRQRAAAGAAVLASVLLPWWLATPHPSAGASRAPATAHAARQDAQPTAWAAPPTVPMPIATVRPRPAQPAPARSANDRGVPYRYVGQWTEGRVTAVVLRNHDVSLVIRVPGPVDARYDARSIDDRRVVLWDRALQRDVEVPLVAVATAAGAAPAAAPWFAADSPNVESPAVVAAAPQLPSAPAGPLPGSDPEPEN